MASPRILVIDDDFDIRELLRILLEFEGYRVSVAACQDDALRKISESPFDLILLDVVMPGLDGWKLSRIIRSRWPQIPVFFMTAKVDFDYERAVRNGEIHGYIYKPFAYDDMQELARKAVSLRGSKVMCT